MRATLVVSTAVVVALLAVPAPALAGPDDACIDVANEAEILKKDVTRLTKAREKLRGCAAAECAAVIRDDCRQSLADLEEKIPTVVLIAEDEVGTHLLDAKVTLDGAAFASLLDGKPTTVDAGTHSFVFSRAGAAPVEVRLVLVVGQKNVPVLARFPSPSRPAPTVTPNTSPGEPSTEPARASSSSGGELRWAGLGTAAVGVIGLGLGGFFGLRASSKQSDAKCPDNRCKDEASASALRDAQSTGNLSTAFFVGGALLAAGGVTLFLLAPRATTASPSARLIPTAGPGGAGLSLDGWFF